MSEPNYEALGRYTHLLAEVQKLTAERNSLVTRVGAVLKNATQAPFDGHAPRALNFEAVRKLLNEAEVLDSTIRRAVDEVNELAPLANKPPLS